jgi:hypothetical protein
MPDEPQSSGTTRAKLARQNCPCSATLDSAEPPLFRFDLRQLLCFVAFLSGLLAAIVSLPGLVAAALLLAVLVVGAHLFSTALASRLRAQTDESHRFKASTDATGSTCTESSAAANLSLKRSPWHRRGSTSLPWLPRVILGGSLGGAMVGAVVLFATIGHRTSAVGILVGSASLAVVGGWIAFLSGSFYGIFRHGLRDALAESRPDEPTQLSPANSVPGRP